MSTTTTEYSELAQRGQEQFLQAVRESQQAIVDAVSAWSQTVQTYATSGPQLPDPRQLPTAEQIIDNTFDLVEKLVAGQREFARNLVAATAPATETLTAAAKPPSKK